MCSNRLAISHITQCEMPFSRNAIALAAATAPMPTSPRVHSHTARPAVLPISTTLSAWLTISNPLTSRICRCTVSRNSCIAARAKPASRCECENSLTVAMLV